MAQNRYLLIILALLVSATLFAQTEVTLKNGLSVNVINDSDSKLVTVLLVCPYPHDLTREEMADLSLINRLIWRGGSALGKTIEEHEFSMFALRFGGSIGSQMLSDALVINYTMPVELLDEVLSYITVQWNSVNPDQAELTELASALARQEQSVASSSVKRQVIRQLEKRLWSGLSYADSTFGSQEALSSSTPERVKATFAAFHNLNSWKLYIKGAVDSEALTSKLETTVGTIAAVQKQPEEFSPARADLGVKLELPARLSSRHALLAYRLPEANKVDQVAIALMAETWGRSPQFEALKEDLQKVDIAAELTIGLDVRKYAGSLYIYASWQGDLAQDDILDRMKFIAEGVRGEESSNEAFESARKALKINFYSSARSSRKAVNMQALQSLQGIASLDYINRINELTPASLSETMSGLVKPENSLMLVTVTK